MNGISNSMNINNNMNNVASHDMSTTSGVTKRSEEAPYSGGRWNNCPPRHPGVCKTQYGPPDKHHSSIVQSQSQSQGNGMLANMMQSLKTKLGGM